MKPLSALFLFLVLSLQHLYASDKPIKGALCLLRADQQILLVQEVFTNKYSLPGGTIEKNEAPELAAQRETWEETGIKVTADRLLGMTDSAYVFNCVTEEKLTVYQYLDRTNARSVPLWSFPHYGIEVRRVFVVPPEFVQREQYRYPEQWNGIVANFFQATDQPVSYISDLSEEAPLIHKQELRLLTWLQAVLPEWTESSSFQWLQQTSLVSGRLIFSLFIGVALMVFGLRFSLRLLLVSFASVAMVVITRSYLMVPRPFEYLPSVRLGNSFGFSVPDLPIVIAAVVAMLMLKTEAGQKWICRRGSKLIVSLVATAYGFVQFYLGNQFIAGVLISLLTGWLVVQLCSLVTSRIGSGEGAIEKSALWLLVALLSAGFIYHVYNPEIADIFLSAVVLTILLLNKQSIRLLRFSLSRMLLVFALIIGLNIAVNSLVQMVSYSGLYSAMAGLVYSPLLICLLWLTLVRKA